MRRLIFVLALLCGAVYAAPVVSLSPTSVNFGTQVSGTTSSPIVVTLTNTGTTTLTITSILLMTKQSASFSQTSTCGASLGAGSNCTVTLRFAPTYIAPMTTNLVFTTNAPSSPDTVIVSGIGTASGMVLYPGGTLTPKQQINVFSGPINVNSQSYPYLIGSGGMFNAFSPGQYLTGQTLSVNLGCTASNCTGSNATYLDHVNPTGSPSGGACPALVFNTGTNPLDDIINAAGSLGYINNLILQNASYGAGAGGNTATPSYLWTQDWANNLYTDCVHHDPSLDRANAAFYLPGDYICVGGTFPNCVGGGYWQMQKKTCTNTDTSDIRCKTAATPPACITPGTTSSPCTDGAGTNSAVWTSLGANAPLLDSNCNSNYPGTLCYNIPLDKTQTHTIVGTTATVYLTAPSTQQVGQNLTVQNVAGPGNATFLNCTTCPITAVSTSAPYSIQYTDSSGAFSGTVTAGAVIGTHNVNLNTNNATLAILQRTMPIPYEQQSRVRFFYIYQQVDAHFKNSLGYIRAFGSKGGEMATDLVTTWPWYGTNVACSPASSCTTFTSWEKMAYTFAGQNGAGTDFAGSANLNNNPGIEAGYMSANNSGMDNNAQGTNHAYSLDCYSSVSAALGCGATYGTGVPPAGALWHGGDWALEFQTYPTMANGQHPVNTLQTTNESTPGSSPGSCQTGTCSGGSCTTSGPVGAGAITGAMAQDSTCTTATFPGPNGYPGNLPLGKKYGENNEEMYFCDAALGLLPSATYSTLPASICSTLYPTSYQATYKTAFQTFLSGANALPVFTSATTITFNFGVPDTFSVSASGVPIPSLALTSGTLPTGVTFVDNGNGTATLSGTPSSTATAVLQFTATNVVGSVNQSFTILSANQNSQGTGAGTGSFVLSFTPSGPPGYVASSRSTANPGPISAIFTSTAPTVTTCSGNCLNATAYDTTVNPAGTDCYTRITDGTSFPSGKSVGNFSYSGGDNDSIWSINEDYLGVTASGGFVYVLGLSLNSSGCVQVTNAPGNPAIKVLPPISFSQTTDNVFYAATSVTAVSQYTISSIDSMPSGVPVFDVAGTGICPGLPALSWNWNSILNVTSDDNRFTMVLSTAGQNTGTWVVSWDRNLGCSVLDFHSGQVWGWCKSPSTCNTSTPILGTIPTSSPNCWGSNPTGSAGGIHDAIASRDGSSIFITMNGIWTQGVCAGVTNNNQFVTWQIGTINTFWCDGESSVVTGHCGSHSSVGFNSVLAPSFQNFNKRPLPNTSNRFSDFYTALNTQDTHQGWPAGDNTDTFPYWIGESGSVLAAAASGCANSPNCPTYPNNIVFGVPVFSTFPPGNPLIVFGHTFSCNPVGAPFGACPDGIRDPFGSGNAIGVPSPKGNYFCFASSMLHAMGNDNTGVPRSDGFCIHLQ